MEKKALDILKDNALKVTKTRVSVLEAFISKEFALSYLDLTPLLPGKEDKVTIYRTLKTFKDNGIIHEIEDVHANKFALCSHSCSKEEHHDSHAHFKCFECENIYCLETPNVKVNIPEGYIIQQYNLSFKGICLSCSK